MWHSRPQTPIKGAPFSTLPAHANTHTHTLVLTHTIESYLWKFYCNYKSFRMLFSSASSSSFVPLFLFLLLLPLFFQLLLLVLLLLLFLLPPSIFPDTLKFTQNSFPQPSSTLHSIYLPPFPALFLFQLIHFGFRFVLLVRSLASRFPTLSTSLFLLVFIALFRNLLFVCQFVVGFRFVSFRF